MDDGHPQLRQGLIQRAISQPVSSVADAVVPALVDAVDLNEALSRIDIDEVLSRVDLDELLERLDVNAILETIDIDRLLGRIDVEGLISRIAVDALIARINVDALLDRVDIDQLVEKVNVDALIHKVDVDAIIQRVDVDAIVQQVDVDAIVGRIDLDGLIERLNVNAVAQRIELEAMVARTTKGALRSGLDLLRRQVAGIDVLMMRLRDRMSRKRDPLPAGPPVLVGRESSSDGTISGRYAGPASRALAFGIDLGMVWGSFVLASAAVTFFVRVVSGYQLQRDGGWPWAIAGVAWWFLYFWVSLTITGRTVGKASMGLRIVSESGEPVSQRRALVRVLAFPLSFIVLGLGLLMALVDRRRRALHDVIAGTSEVYDWGDRPAELPAPITGWLNREGALPMESDSRSAGGLSQA